MNAFPPIPPSSRRQFLARSASCIGLIAFWHLLAGEGRSATPTTPIAINPLESRPPHFRPRAKNVIFIFMAGGPSHLDLFDPKPQMAKWHGQPLPASLIEDLPDPVLKASATVMASPRTFRRHGQSGIEFSDLLPHTGGIADELCLIR